MTNQDRLRPATRYVWDNVGGISKSTIDAQLRAQGWASVDIQAIWESLLKAQQVTAEAVASAVTYIRENRSRTSRAEIDSKLQGVGWTPYTIRYAWSVAADDLPAAASAGSYHPPSVVREYKGKQQADAVKAFRHDAAQLALQGYQPTSQSWAPGQWGCGAFLLALVLMVVLVGFLIFLYLLIVKPDGTLTVTYARMNEKATGSPQEIASDQPADAEQVKVCPQCAEEVKAAARICRFCRYEFEDSTEP